MDKSKISTLSFIIVLLLALGFGLTLSFKALFSPDTSVYIARMENPADYAAFPANDAQMALRKATAAEIQSDPIIRQVLQQAEQYQNKGYAVQSLTIVLPKTDTTVTAADFDYYYHNSQHWAMDSGQHFRYYYTILNLRQPEIDLLAQTDAKTWQELFVADTGYRIQKAKSTRGVYRSPQDVFIAENQLPFSGDISPKDRFSLNGTVTICVKNIVIEDTLEKNADYTYFPWGCLSELSSTQTFTVDRYAADTGKGVDEEQHFTHDFTFADQADGFAHELDILAATAQRYHNNDVTSYIEMLDIDFFVESPATN